VLLVPFAHLACALRTQQGSPAAEAEPEAAEPEHLERELGSVDPEELRSLQAELEDLEGKIPLDPKEQESLDNDRHVGVSGRVKSSSSVKECGSPAVLHWLGYDHFNFTEEPLGDALDGTEELLKQGRHAPALDGSQWCPSWGSDDSMRRGRVALVLTGEAFRARNFFVRRKYDCSRPSVEVQRRLANNHLDKIVTPIEQELGMKVDIYLTISGCSYERMKGKSEEVTPSFNSTETLVRFYGGKLRVKGLFSDFRREGDMYEHLADVHVKLDAAMAAARKGVYEYFIMFRYDIHLDRKFTDLAPKPATGHKGLSFYMSTHDFAWSFPGEMWNCMRKFWDGCMRETNQSGLGTVSWERREQLSCFQIGPVSTPRWAQGFAFDQALAAIGKGVNWPGAKPAVKLHRTGCSGFDARGDELRCISGWFWPPRSQWENRFMPYCFHIG